MDWAWGGKIVAYFFVFVVVIMCSSPVMGDLYLYSLWVNLNTHRVESQLYLYNSHNGLLFYCSRVYDIAGSFLFENQTWLAMMLLETFFSSLLISSSTCILFWNCVPCLFEHGKCIGKVDIRIWNVKQPASICMHLGSGKNQFQALKECCSLRNEFYFIFACRNKSMEKHWRPDFAALNHEFWSWFNLLYTWLILWN